MANTLRESTAHPHSENASDTAGSRPVPALGSGPHLSTANLAVCQEFNHLRLPIREPMISCIASAVDMAYDSHSKTHGSTVSLFHGNMVGQKLFSVSIYPARTIKLWAPPRWQQLFAFALANTDLLLKPIHALGTWTNDWTGEHILDVVVLSSDRDEALALALHYGQAAAYDLELRREIPVSWPSEKLLATRAGGVNA
jgi:hypothetical protein